MAALPSYRRLAPSPQRAGQGSRIQSEPIFQVINNNNTPSSTSRNILQIENEPGVHGGVAPVRPNMQESMVFLRKLFSHQQEGNPFPNLMSPPDSPMCKYSLYPCFFGIYYYLNSDTTDFPAYFLLLICSNSARKVEIIAKFIHYGATKTGGWQVCDKTIHEFHRLGSLWCQRETRYF